MAGAGFRMFFGDRPAALDELARIESITVEQEIELAWEARIKMVICLDESGRWRNQPAEFAMPWSRVRVEVQLGENAFKPLIDGPLAGYSTEMSSSPGQSVVSLVVRDDSVLLNREEGTEVFENRTDSDLASEMFGRLPSGSAPAAVLPSGVMPTTTSHPTTVKRGTPIQFARELARSNGYFAYVLPGDSPGQSIGCFRPPETGAPTLPALVLLGAGRNLIDVTFDDDGEGQETTRARSLRISDQQVVSAEQSTQSETLLGDLPAVSGDNAALRELPPQQNTREDPAEEATNQNRRASYSVSMSGQVVPGCYDGVLAPYQTATVRAGDTPYSGRWLIHKVTHRITPSIYTQAFQAKRNSLSDTGANPLLAATGVF